MATPATECRLADYTAPEYRVAHIDLDFSLHYTRTRVGVKLTLYRSPATPHGTDLVLHGEDLELKSVALKLCADSAPRPLAIGEEARVTTEGALVIRGALLPSDANAKFEVHTVVDINPTENTKLAGLYKSDELLCTHCEAEGFRRITFYIDRPDVMATYTTVVRAPRRAFPILLANGNPEPTDASRTTAWYTTADIYDAATLADLHVQTFDDPFPKPSYLFALVAGPLSSMGDTFTTCTGKPVEVTLWCEPKDKDKLRWSLEALKKAMRWDEERFGRVFDLRAFHLVAVSHFNMGAMENKGLNIFNSSLLLASKDTATDQDHERCLNVVGHEYFHNWTGNRVTCRDWFQLTLKEGLTVYRDQLFSADMGSEAVVRIQHVIIVRSLQFAEDAGPMAHPIRPQAYRAIDNFYTLTVYHKGSEVIRMYETLLGHDGFRKGMDLYFERHDGQAVTCDEFRAAMADANGRDLSQFERWYRQAGTPTVTVTGETYDAAKREYRLRFKQELPQGIEANATIGPLHIPIPVGLLGRASTKEIVRTRVLELRETEQEFVFHDINEAPIPSILRGFSAPIKLVFPDMSNADYGFLMAYDTDPINRWDAAQKLLSKQIIGDACSGGASDENSETMRIIVTAFHQVLASIPDRTTDRAFLAYMITLPDVHGLVGTAPTPCDPVAIQHAQWRLREWLARRFQKEMTQAYEALSAELKGKPYDVNPADVGARKMRNTLLSYLTIGGDTELAYAQYTTTDNMTDRSAALQYLSRHPTAPQYQKTLDHFLEASRDDAACVDKWFSIQAGAHHDGVLDIVESLVAHPLFDLANPNRVRALLTTFANNLGHFHRADGKGYALVADNIIKLDAVNDRAAARLATTLISYQRVTSERQDLMKRALRRIADVAELSTHTSEIVTKALE